MTSRHHHLLLAAVLAFAATTLAYLPGLSGGFLFDDFVNLRLLGAFGPIDDATTLLYYLTSGTADPTGRPVALASFLLDARDWPAAPDSFKRTNLLLHLLNGALLIWVLRLLERRLAGGQAGVARVNGLVAVLAGAVWMAHPLFVSTTLYVVQRHAMLPLTFVLLAFLAWERVVLRLERGRTAAGLAWVVFGIGGMTLLAGLSKANGFLAPLLILVAAWTVYRPTWRALAPGPRRSVRMACGILALPSVAIVAYLLSRIPGAEAAYAARDFTLGERLLTQPRALLDYLGRLLVPRSDGGLYADNFAASTSLFDPWTTLPALILVAGAVAVGIVWRRRHPALAFALLFFFAAHLVESSVLQLELYFEHRNYVPAAFLFWPLARWLLGRGALERLRPALAVAMCAVLLAFTYARTSLWGDDSRLAAVWAADNPGSSRSQIAAARNLAAQSPQRAVERVRSAARDHPRSVDVALELIALECGAGHVSAESLAHARRVLSEGRAWHQGVNNWFQTALAGKLGCSGIGQQELQSLIEALEGNPHIRSFPSRRQNVQHLRGMLALARHDPAAALRAFDRALALRPDPVVALNQAAQLGNQGYIDAALRHLDQLPGLIIVAERPSGMPMLHDWILRATGYYENEVSHLRAALLQAQAEEADPAASGDPLTEPPA